MPSSHTRRVFEQVSNNSETSTVVTSWRRCVDLHGLAPDGTLRPYQREQAAIRSAQERNEALLRAADHAMDDLLNLLAGSDHMIFLADADGVCIDARSRRSEDFWGRPRGLWVGSDFRESAFGTNGVGTILCEGRPLSIAPDQHFHLSNIGIVCCGAPIFSPEGMIAGALDVSSDGSRSDPLVMSMLLATTVETARRIELAMLSAAFPEARLMLASKTGRLPGAVLAVHPDGVVLGATKAARALLGLSPEQLRNGLPTTRIWPEQDRRDLSTEAAEKRAINAALAHHGGNLSQAARSLGISRSTLYRKIAEWRSPLPQQLIG